MKGKSIIVYYATALIGGIVTGGCFVRAQYHKGQADAYRDISKTLEELKNDMEEQLEKCKENKVE